MSESTVNISDFRCRGMKARPAQIFARTSNRPYELFVLGAERAMRNTASVEPSGDAGSCTVFDIGQARDAQRYIPRIVPLHRGKVLRFRSDTLEPHLAVLQTFRRPEPRNAAPDGPLDFPPAA